MKNFKKVILQVIQLFIIIAKNAEETREAKEQRKNQPRRKKNRKFYRNKRR